MKRQAFYRTLPFLYVFLLTGIVTGLAAETTPLIQAVRDTDLAKVRQLLAKGAQINQVDQDGKTALIAAMDQYWDNPYRSNKEIEVFDFLLNAGANPDVGLPLTHTRSGLIFIQKLLAKGANPNVVDTDRNPILFSFFSGFEEDEALAIINAGADPNTPNSKGIPPLVAAANKSTLPVVKALVEKGAKVQALSPVAPKTPLAAAVDHGSDEIVRYLLLAGARDPDALADAAGKYQFKDSTLAAMLDAGGNPDAMTSSGKPLVVLAVENGRLEFLKVLAAKGYNMGASGAKYPRTALATAIGSGKTEILSYLMTLRIPDPDALRAAVEQKRLDLVQALTEQGLDLKKTDADGNSVLHFARDPVLVKYLLTQGLDPNKRNLAGQTPFNLACRYSGLDVVTMLLDGGADIEAADQSGQTPLLRSMGRSNYDDKVPEYLISKGAKVNVSSGDPYREGYTPLWIAVLQLRLSLAQKLLDAGAIPGDQVMVPRSEYFSQDVHDVESMLSGLFLGDLGDFSVSKSIAGREKLSLDQIRQKYYRKIGLIEALWIANADWARKPGTFQNKEAAAAFLGSLIEKGVAVPVNQTDGKGVTLLHWAAGWAPAATLRTLVLKGSATLIRDKDGGTPMETAARFGNTAAVEYFAKELKQGFELNRKDGKSLLHLACQGGSPEFVDYLLSSGQDPNVLDAAGRSPVFELAGNEAISSDSAKTVLENLLKHGARNIVDAKGQTIVDLVEQSVRENSYSSLRQLRDLLFKIAGKVAWIQAAGGMWLRGFHSLNSAKTIQVPDGAFVTIKDYFSDSIDVNTKTKAAVQTLPVSREVLSRFADWIEVEYQGTSGWIYGESLGTWYSSGVPGVELLTKIPQFWLPLTAGTDGGKPKVVVWWPDFAGFTTLVFRPRGTAANPTPVLNTYNSYSTKTGDNDPSQTLTIRSVTQPSPNTFQIQAVDDHGNPRALTLSYNRDQSILTVKSGDTTEQWIDTGHSSRQGFDERDDSGGYYGD